MRFKILKNLIKEDLKQPTAEQLARQRRNEHARKLNRITHHRRSKVVLAVFLLSVVSIICGSQLAYADGSGNTVTTNVSYRSVRTPSQQSSFYAQSRRWVFFENGVGNFSYTSSLDGTIWEPEVEITTESMPYSFGAMFDVAVDSSNRVYFVVSPLNSTSNVSVSSGKAYANGSIEWMEVNGSTRQVVWNQPTNFRLQDPVVEIDSEGYPYIGVSCYYHTGTSSNVTVLKSSSNNGTWATEWSTNLSYSSTGILLSSLTALPNSTMYCSYLDATSANESARYVKGKLWNGSEWLLEETCTVNPLPQYGFSSHSDVVVGRNIHKIYTANGSLDLCYTIRDYNTSIWIEQGVVTTGLYNYQSCGVLTSYGETLDAYWLDYSNNTVKYSNLGYYGWSNPVDWITETSPFSSPMVIQAEKQLDANGGGVIYQTNVSGVHHLKFGTGDAPPIPIVPLDSPLSHILWILPFLLIAILVGGTILVAQKSTAMAIIMLGIFILLGLMFMEKIVALLGGW